MFIRVKLFDFGLSTKTVVYGSCFSSYNTWKQIAFSPFDPVPTTDMYFLDDSSKMDELLSTSPMNSTSSTKLSVGT